MSRQPLFIYRSATCGACQILMSISIGVHGNYPNRCHWTGQGVEASNQIRIAAVRLDIRGFPESVIQRFIAHIAPTTSIIEAGIHMISPPSC